MNKRGRPRKQLVPKFEPGKLFKIAKSFQIIFSEGDVLSVGWRDALTEMHYGDIFLALNKMIGPNIYGKIGQLVLYKDYVGYIMYNKEVRQRPLSRRNSNYFRIAYRLEEDDAEEENG
jgi:hypothetical protein